MTNKQCEILLKPFTDKCERDNDPYFIVHFSRQEDYFKGYWEGLDQTDALIVLRSLVEEFRLTDLLKEV